MTDDELLAGFEGCSMSADQFTHRQHVRMAYLYASRHSLEDATDRMRTGIKAFNKATETPEALDRGYHETITTAFMRLVFAANVQTGPHDSSARFCDAHPELLTKLVLRRYYSRERIVSWEAKADFVEPDLCPLPSANDDAFSDERTRDSTMDISELMNEYVAGPQQLRDAIAGMTAEQIDAAPVPGKWSTRQVICHLSDFEPVYADRMKHVIAEDQPPFAGGFHQQFADHLAYDQRDIEEDIQLMELTRNQMARILRSLPAEAFERTGIHSVDGSMTLAQLLQRITNHIPHHVQFIEEKKRALV